MVREGEMRSAAVNLITRADFLEDEGAENIDDDEEISHLASEHKPEVMSAAKGAEFDTQSDQTYEVREGTMLVEETASLYTGSIVASS